MNASLQAMRLDRNATIFLVAILVSIFLHFGPAHAATRITLDPEGIAAPSNEAGASIALSADTVVVGAPSASPSPYLPSGAVEVFRNTGAGWIFEAVLKPGDAATGARFGASVALDGDVAVVTAPAGSSGLAPSIYTFARSGTVWTQVNKMAQGNSDETAISLSGNTLALPDGKVYLRAGSGWALEAQLQPDSGNGESFGRAVAVDGERIAIGSVKSAYHVPEQFYIYTFTRVGSVWSREGKIDLGSQDYVAPSFFRLAVSNNTIVAGTTHGVSAFVRNGGTWSLQGTLDPLGATTEFGKSLAIDGDHAIVGAPGDTILGHGNAGSIYLFTRASGTWTRTMRLYDAATSDFSFALGASLALEGETIVSGSPRATTESGASGKGSVFKTSGGSWQLVANLSSGNSHTGDGFGWSVARAGSNLLVGAPGAASDSVWVTGAAYIFSSLSGSWVESSRLIPTSTRTQGFGVSTSLDGNTAVIGAPRDDQVGAAYVYVENNGSWPLQARLTSGSSALTNFGQSVSVEDDVLVVGEPGPSGLDVPGKTHVFERAGSTWSAQFEFQATDSSNGDLFGSAVALSGDRLVVGAPRADIGIEQDSGAAYIFRRSGALWIQEAKVTAPVPITGSYVGGSVAIAGDTVVVGGGAYSTLSSARGGAFVFHRTGGQWDFVASLQPLTNESSASFGYSVSIAADESTILVGTPYRTDISSYAGAVYAFRNNGFGWALSSNYYGTPPPTPFVQGDHFGTSVSASTEGAAFGAPQDGTGGAVYSESVGNAVFKSGFD